MSKITAVSPDKAKQDIKEIYTNFQKKMGVLPI